MIGLLQRVTEARVEAGDATIAEIGIGLLVLVAIERGTPRSKPNACWNACSAMGCFRMSRGRWTGA